jgi:nicotinamidase-related amidase
MIAMNLQLDPKKTALVLIDLQQGIVGQTLAPHAAADVVRRGAELGRAFAATGSLIVRVNVAFAADDADRLQLPVDAPMPVRPGGWPAGWSDLVPEIAALPGAINVTKRQWGAFHGTELDLQLRRRGITTIVLGGIATNFGVESTAREAWQHNYAVVIAEDATTTLDAEMHRMAVGKILPRIARVRSTAEVLQAIGSKA